ILPRQGQRAVATGVAKRNPWIQSRPPDPAPAGAEECSACAQALENIFFIELYVICAVRAWPKCRAFLRPSGARNKKDITNPRVPRRRAAPRRRSTRGYSPWPLRASGFCPDGAEGCSHGCSEAQPVEINAPSRFCPGRGSGMSIFYAHSVEHVLLLILYAMGAEYTQQFRLEILPPVMLGLARDVLLDSHFLRFTDSKGAISLLPCKFVQEGKLSVNPFRRAPLNSTHQI